VLFDNHSFVVKELRYFSETSEFRRSNSFSSATRPATGRTASPAAAAASKKTSGQLAHPDDSRCLSKRVSCQLFRRRRRRTSGFAFEKGTDAFDNTATDSSRHAY
jgi:hypothetical protein